MSDYLWDRTGERDAEVERLETLLGAFAHRPRALELPAEESIAAAPRKRGPFDFARRALPSRLFAPAGLAAAAALALVIFGAAALLLQRAHSGNEGGAAAARSPEDVQRGAASKSPGPARREPEPEAARRAPEPAASVGGAKLEAPETVSKPTGPKVEKGVVESLARGPLKRKGLQAAAPAAGREKVARAERGGGAAGEVFTFEAMRAGGGASAFVENTRLLTKERLVYALRLTGAKLRGVRQKTQGVEDPGARPR